MAKGQKGVAEGNSGAKYQIKSIGKDSKGEYYISPSTGKKVYKSGVNKGDNENPKTGNITAKLVKEEDHELKAAIKRRDENRKKMKFSDAEHIYAKEFDAIMKKRGYGKHNPIPLRLSDKDIKD